MNEGPSLLTHEFRLGAEYRRCGWYVFLGTISIICIAAFLRHHGLVPGNGGWVPFAIGSFVAILPAGGLLLAVYRWRLRVDEEGLARRRLWRWDLWKWGDFETGEIQRRGEGFISAALPWWRKELSFSLLDERDRAFVLGACKFFFQPAEEPPLELPDGEIVLRYQLLRTMSFRKEGVAGHTGRGDFEFDWSEVKVVRLLYFDHWSDELCKIELELPTRTLRIENVNNITGPGFDSRNVAAPKVIPKVIVDFLQQHVPQEKLARHALHGPPATLSECEHRRRKLQGELRNVTWYYRTAPTGLLILTSLWLGPKLFAFWVGPPAFLNAEWVVLVAVLTVATILSQPLMVWGFLRERRQRLTKALRDLDAWENENIERDVTEDRTLVASF